MKKLTIVPNQHIVHEESEKIQVQDSKLNAAKTILRE
jgi:hypothetical protein